MECEHKLDLCMICLNKLRDKVFALEKINVDIQVQLYKFLNLKDLYRAMLTPGDFPKYTVDDAWTKFNSIIKQGYQE